MYNDEVFKITVRQHNAQKIAIKQLKVKSIHKDIIRLKQENRNIGDKINSFMKHVSHNSIECTKFYVCGKVIKNPTVISCQVRELRAYCPLFHFLLLLFFVVCIRIICTILTIH